MPVQFSKRGAYISVAVILTVMSHYYLKYFFAYIIFGKERYNTLHHWQQTMLVQGMGLFLCFLVVAVICSFSFSKMMEMLGLDKKIGKPFLYALIATLPSFIGYAIINGYNPETSFKLIAWYSLWPGFNEELVFRAFIVGILVRYSNWNFVIVAILSGLLFASGHLYQASSIMEGVQIFLFTSGAGIGFSVFYKYWDWNIWFPIFMHTLMNFAYVLFAWHGNALMSGTENIFRFTTIGIGIVLTVWQKVQADRRKAAVVEVAEDYV